MFNRFTGRATLFLLILSPFCAALATDDNGQTALTSGSVPTYTADVPAAPLAGPRANRQTTLFNRNLQSKGDVAVPDKIYTTEEIRSAKPLEWSTPSPVNNLETSDSPEDAPVSTDPPREGTSGKPNAAADEDAQMDFADQWLLIEDLEQLEKSGLLPDQTSEPAGDNADSSLDAEGADFSTEDITFGTQDIYTPYRGNYWTSTWTTYPHRAIGKLLIDGGGYCTAQVISPKNIIVTAAHCVYDGGWYGGWTFVPAERYGVAPYGQFRWARADILPGWVSPGGRRYDVALIQLANNSSGHPVSYYTGWLGWRINYPYVRNLHSFGYASNISTQYTSVCTAESFYAGCEGTDVLVKGCNMTYGSSGGGWLDVYRPFESGSMNYVESVVSGPSCAGGFGQTYVGPRFSSDNFGTLCGRYGGC